MTEASGSDWQALARDKQIDPDEVRLVFDRYDAQRRFSQGRGAPLALDQWFRFYHLEKSGEGEQLQPAPSGCSVDSDAVNNACIRRPAEFFEVLKAYASAGGAG
jgi:hypothetical protein